MFYNGVIAKADQGFDKKSEKGPFDIIGDVHGCYDELIELLGKLGYSVFEDQAGYDYGLKIENLHGRKVVFVGDFVDRGPKNPWVLKLVMTMVNNNQAFCIPGNHDEKLMRKLMGRNVKLVHGLETTIEQLNKETSRFRKAVKSFLESLPTYLSLDDGNLIVSHAGLREQYHGKTSEEIREFSLYGETTGEHDENGLPIRVNWAEKYKGNALVVYGHTPVEEPLWNNNTVDVDTGCVFGGALTALRYPEREIVSVKAHKTYSERGRAFGFQA